MARNVKKGGFYCDSSLLRFPVLDAAKARVVATVSASSSTAKLGNSGTMKVNVTVLEPLFPARSVKLTLTVYVPLLRLLVLNANAPVVGFHCSVNPVVFIVGWLLPMLVSVTVPFTHTGDPETVSPCAG